jgi:hypothetical protein
MGHRSGHREKTVSKMARNEYRHVGGSSETGESYVGNSLVGSLRFGHLLFCLVGLGVVWQDDWEMTQKNQNPPRPRAGSFVTMTKLNPPVSTYSSLF